MCYLLCDVLNVSILFTNQFVQVSTVSSGLDSVMNYSITPKSVTFSMLFFVEINIGTFYLLIFLLVEVG